MVRAERDSSRERERKRKKELELARYSHNLSHRILTQEGRGPLRPDIPEKMMDSFQVGSLFDRDAYWKESAPTLNYGQQMVEWIGSKSGTPGISQWVAKQTDEGVVHILKEVGLKGEHKEIAEYLKEEEVQHILTVINNDLQKAGEPLLDATKLDDDQASSLIFYAHYLHPNVNNPGEDASSLIDVLVGTAMEESGNDLAKSIDLLQKISPLFRVAGEEGQHVLGALTVARAHALGARDELIKVDQNIPLNDEEKFVLEFLKKHGEMSLPEPMESGKAYNIQQVFDDLDAQPTPGHTYWLDHEVPADFAAKLTPEQLRDLQLRLPLFQNLRYEVIDGTPRFTWKLNDAVFEPANALKNNERFNQAEFLTQNDSGLFALAASSSATPEEQTALYKQLGETVMKAHLANPKLVEEFLQAQTLESKSVFALHEQNRYVPRINQRSAQLEASEIAAFEQKFGKKYSTLTGHSPEEQKFIDDADKRIMGDLQGLYKQLISKPGDYDDRLLALKIVPSETPGQPTVDIDIPATLAIWPERIQALQEVLQKDPLTLTPEQIRQIEFLSHSVNVVKIMEMLQGTAQVTEPEQQAEVVTPPLPAPIEGEHEVEPQGEQAPVAPEIPEAATAPSVAEHEETVGEEAPQLTHATLNEFFQLFDNLEEQTGFSRRTDFTVPDSTRMAQFSTEGQDIMDYTIYANVDGKKELSIYNLVSQEGKEVQLFYNTENPFLGSLMEQGSLSMHSLNQLYDSHYGENTLLAYILEASKDATQQETLFRNLFSQITELYTMHPEFREHVLTYLTSVGEKVPFANGDQIQDIFGSEDALKTKLDEISGKLAQNSAFTVRDFSDVGLLAFPFNLKFIADRMEVTYESHQTPPELPQAQ